MAKKTKPHTVISLFSGAGGLDIGFENEGFQMVEAVELDDDCVATLKHNRPDWSVKHTDISDYSYRGRDVDLIIGGPPCQGFSLGGHRRSEDKRNLLYKEMVRIAAKVKPRAIVMENVLNLRTMTVAGSNKPVVDQIAEDFQGLGYSTFSHYFRVSGYGVPQTRRRFVLFGFLGDAPKGYCLPHPSGDVGIRDCLYDLGQDDSIKLPNHDPSWGFRTSVHKQTGEPFDPSEEAIPVRLSRTASDGNPIRSFNAPFPAVDTGTIWGWARGHVTARREKKDRKNGKFVRNPKADVTLWRISASQIRAFTEREYARLQTFPDDWFFTGNAKRNVHKQVGNAVPVKFAEKIAANVSAALEAKDRGKPFHEIDPYAGNLQLSL